MFKTAFCPFSFLISIRCSPFFSSVLIEIVYIVTIRLRTTATSEEDRKSTSRVNEEKAWESEEIKLSFDPIPISKRALFGYGYEAIGVIAVDDGQSKSAFQQGDNRVSTASNKSPR